MVQTAISASSDGRYRRNDEFATVTTGTFSCFRGPASMLHRTPETGIAPLGVRESPSGTTPPPEKRKP